ncbi:MAG TPA: hypothetical protein VJN44_01710, partial [Roseateles sp.]|nr:hypothetical protein [Roseateles sp.]
MVQALAALVAPAEPPSRLAQAVPAQTGLQFDTAQAAPGELDRLLAGIDQAHAQLTTLRQGMDLLAQARGALLQPGSAAAADEALARLERLLDGGLHRLGRELQDAREDAEQLRLLPAAQFFTGLQRAARDDAQAQG